VICAAGSVGKKVAQLANDFTSNGGGKESTKRSNSQVQLFAEEFLSPKPFQA